MKKSVLNPPATHRHAVIPLADLPPGAGHAFNVAGRDLALFNSDGRVFAIDNASTHDGGPLPKGSPEGPTTAWPRHGAEFDLRSGVALTPPASADVQTYPVFVHAGMIEVEI